MSVRKRKDGRWQYDIVIHKQGQRIRDRGACKGARNRAEALEHERRRRAELEAETGAPPPERMTFAEHAEDVMRLHAAVHNKHSERISKRVIFERHLKPYFGALFLDEIDALRIADYTAAKLGADKPVAPKTINNHLFVLRKSLTLAREWKRLHEVPKVGLLKVPEAGFDFLTFEEAARLLAAAEREPRWWTMILVALRTGLRAGELTELRWGDVDLAKGILRVQRAIYQGVIDTPKGGRSREIPLGEDVRRALEAHRHDRGELVLCTEDGRHLTACTIRQPLRRMCKRAGLRQIGWHVLRHTFASHLVMRGAPFKAVQELLGHRTIDITMRYAHLSPHARVDAVRLLDGAGPQPHGREEEAPR